MLEFRLALHIALHAERPVVVRFLANGVGQSRSK